MAIEVIGNKEQVQWLQCTTSGVDLGINFNKDEDAESFLGWLDSDARKYTHEQLLVKLTEWRDVTVVDVFKTLSNMFVVGEK